MSLCILVYLVCDRPYSPLERVAIVGTGSQLGIHEFRFIAQSYFSVVL